MQTRFRAQFILGVSLLLPACSDEGEYAPSGSETVSERQQEIINGATPARGSLANLGVVRLANSAGGGCTGTMLTNRHVLTARHCVRDWSGASYTTLRTPVNAILEGATAAQDQIIASSNVFEPTTSSLDVGDYAVIELSAPMRINDAPDTYFRALEARADNQLAGVNVFCVGYGNNTEATAMPLAGGAGFGTLRTATMAIASVTGGVVARNRNATNQIGAPGDSGSTCFTGATPGPVIGPQSTCSGAWVDVNGDGIFTNGNEWSNITQCRGASPDTIRTLVRQNTQATTTVNYTFVPSASFPSSLTTLVEATNQSTSIDARVGASLTEFAARGGKVSVIVQTEPANYMCQQLLAVAPVSGNLGLSGVCISDALVANVMSAS